MTISHYYTGPMIVELGCLVTLNAIEGGGGTMLQMFINPIIKYLDGNG